MPCLLLVIALRLWCGGGGGIFGGGSRGIVSMIVVFVLGGALHGGGLISVFYGFFASIGGIFLLAGELGAENIKKSQNIMQIILGFLDISPILVKRSFKCGVALF